ncbi:Sodium-dependent phosphate transporter 1-B [Thelohanellus kitauei]|uniref:Sodium-dependent phosphate transporter 1-B n=1 Tax=Thelohanellus kitauei TaxID=669202 RepID=A0A0C2JGN9_THEKT|nr:Sodium-dependent phosphate transporter 1-B [Thelohanellus kitauei]
MILVHFLQVPFLKKKFLQARPSDTNNVTVRYAPETDKLTFEDNVSVVVLPNEECEQTSQTPETRRFLKEDSKVALMFEYLQIMASCYGAFAHGGNDVSNSVGPLTTIWLIVTNRAHATPDNKDIWLLAYGAFAIVIGLTIWGKRVLKTVGQDITDITPSMAFSIELGSVVTVLILTRLEFPVSTTHCKIGSLILLGIVTNGLKSVKLKLIVMIFLSWFVTVPVSGAISSLIFYLTRGFVFGFK